LPPESLASRERRPSVGFPSSCGRSSGPTSPRIATEDREIGDAAEVRSILDSLGQPGAELVDQAQTPENKRLLRDQARRAAVLGIFGAPSFVVGEELFWGNDRLADALAWHRVYGGSDEEEVGT
jgi:DSBA-like thioredoxin domain